jgi:hypothetical protein
MTMLPWLGRGPKKERESPVSLVTVCAVSESFTHATVVPALTVTDAGTNAKLTTCTTFAFGGIVGVLAGVGLVVGVGLGVGVPPPATTVDELPHPAMPSSRAVAVIATQEMYKRSRGLESCRISYLLVRQPAPSPPQGGWAAVA